MALQTHSSPHLTCLIHHAAPVSRQGLPCWHRHRGPPIANLPREGTLQFHSDPNADQVAGPAGTLPVAATDPLARRFLMLVEGQCLANNLTTLARKFGYCRQRYYQLLETYQTGGLLAIPPRPRLPRPTRPPRCLRRAGACAAGAPAKASEVTW
jgi:hypothetical protein